MESGTLCPPKKTTISTIEMSCDLQGIQKYQTKQCLPKTGLVRRLDWCNAWTRATLELIQRLDSCNAWTHTMLGLVKRLDWDDAWTGATLGLGRRLDWGDAWTGARTLRLGRGRFDWGKDALTGARML